MYVVENVIYGVDYMLPFRCWNHTNVIIILFIFIIFIISILFVYNTSLGVEQVI